MTCLLFSLAQIGLRCLIESSVILNCQAVEFGTSCLCHWNLCSDKSENFLLSVVAYTLTASVQEWSKSYVSLSQTIYIFQTVYVLYSSNSIDCLLYNNNQLFATIASTIHRQLVEMSGSIFYYLQFVIDRFIHGNLLSLFVKISANSFLQFILPVGSVIQLQLRT